MNKFFLFRKGCQVDYALCLERLEEKPPSETAYLKQLVAVFYRHLVDTDDVSIGALNFLVPGGFDYSLKLVNFKLISMMNISSIFYEIAIRWMPQHLPDH